MASGYGTPEQYLRWYINGENLGLVTSLNTSSKNVLESIDESVSEGLMIEYSSVPDELVTMDDTPDCDDRLHKAIVDYVIASLWDEKEGDEALRQGAKWWRRWFSQVSQYGAHDKIGGPRAYVPANLR